MAADQEIHVKSSAWEFLSISPVGQSGEQCTEMGERSHRNVDSGGRASGGRGCRSLALRLVLLAHFCRAGESKAARVSREGGRGRV